MVHDRIMQTLPIKGLQYIPLIPEKNTSNTGTRKKLGLLGGLVTRNINWIILSKSYYSSDNYFYTNIENESVLAFKKPK